MRFVEKFQRREMDNYTYGEVFEIEAPRSSRPSRLTTRFRTSYNEYLISPSIDDEGDDGDAHPSTLPCSNFLRVAGILDDFLLLVNRVGDKGIDNRARWLATPEARLARPKCNTSRNTSSCHMSIL
jgi:hypothetical protein